MDDTVIPWHSMDSDLAVEEHEPVGLDDALGIADLYLARAGEKFETGEEAIAATMFGFSRSKEDFIEICVNGSAQISYRLEASDAATSWLGKLFAKVYRYKKELHSREELVEKIKEFFTTPIQQIRRQLESSGRSGDDEC